MHTKGDFRFLQSFHRFNVVQENFIARKRKNVEQIQTRFSFLNKHHDNNWDFYVTCSKSLHSFRYNLRFPFSLFNQIYTDSEKLSISNQKIWEREKRATNIKKPNQIHIRIIFQNKMKKNGISIYHIRYR